MATLTLYRWITLTSTELRKQGQDPRYREALTGHDRVLSEPWPRSLGWWCIRDLSAMIYDAKVFRGQDPSCLDVMHCPAASVYSFKERNRLRFGRQYRKIYGNLPWLLQEHCYRGTTEVLNMTPDLSPGGCALRISRSIGVLPIEALCWNILFTDFLDHHSLSFAEWELLEIKKRKEFWAFSFPDQELQNVFASILKRPAELYGAEHSEARSA